LLLEATMKRRLFPHAALLALATLHLTLAFAAPHAGKVSLRHE
jgi:hypothetical protein